MCFSPLKTISATLSILCCCTMNYIHCSCMNDRLNSPGLSAVHIVMSIVVCLEHGKTVMLVTPYEYGIVSLMELLKSYFNIIGNRFFFFLVLETWLL